jgi:hypothetical protein
VRADKKALKVVKVCNTSYHRRGAHFCFPTAVRSYLQDTLDQLDDATTELMTGEGDKVNLQLGDAFVVVDEDYATEYCEKKQVRHAAVSAKLLSLNLVFVLDRLLHADVLL